ncbi:hypothetical protein MMC14_006256 [Varicellaria rhodocarpa]|nr:hypothetical protein [Varicellaria rhodocarpa]
MDLSAGLLGTHIPEHLELSASQKRTILGSKDLNSRTLDIAGLGKSIVTNNRSQNKSQFSTSTRQGQDEESDSIKRLTHGEVLCTTDIRIDIEESRVDMDRKVAYAY